MDAREGYSILGSCKQEQSLINISLKFMQDLNQNCP